MADVQWLRLPLNNEPMNTNLFDLVNDIQTIQQEYGEQMAPAATAAGLAQLLLEAKQQLAYDVPDAYLALLARTDGIEWNGYQLYASKAQPFVNDAGRLKYAFRGLVEVNEQWRTFEPNRQYVFLAESGEQLYCHHLKNGKYEIVDRITKEMDDPATDAFDTCEKLLAKLLSHMLNRYEVQ